MIPTVREIQQAVCERFGLRLTEIISHRRSRRIARPRQIAMYLAHQLTALSFPQIGRLFGGRDHTTVMYACRTIEAICQKDGDSAAVVDALRQQLSGDEQLTFPVAPTQVVAAQYARLAVV